MMNLRNLFSCTALLFAAMLMFTSCNKDDITLDEPNTEQPNSPNANNDEAGFLGLLSTETTTETESSYTDCFIINFPLTVNFPDGSSEVVDNEEQLETLIVTWFENNEDAEEFPTIAFPISVTLADGSTQTVENDEELCELFHECYGDDEWDDEWDEDEYFGECFTLVYPFSVETPDGIVSVGSDEELLALLESLEEEDDFELVFPVNVLLEEDGITLTLHDEDEMEALLEECYDEYDDDDDEWEDDEWEDEYFSECFTPVYPFNVETPNGIVSVGSDEELLALLESLEYGDEFDILFPLTVMLEEDGTTLTLNDEHELEGLLEECYGEWEDCDEIEDFEDCFTFAYPFSVDSDGTITTIDSEEALIEFFENLDEDADFELVYPIDLILTDGTTVTVNNDDEIEEILEECD